MPPGDPRLAVVSRLTGLRPVDRGAVYADTTAIQQAAVDAPMDDDPPWTLCVTTRIWVDPPWSSQVSAIEIVRRNTAEILTNADALIVHGHGEASVGVGRAIELAMRRQLPILYVRPRRTGISREVEGLARSDDRVTIAPVTTRDEIAEAVTLWVRANRRPILYGQRQRLMSEERWRPLQTALLRAWETACDDVDALTQVCRESGCAPHALDDVLAHPLLVASLPCDVLCQLATALGAEVVSDILLPTLLLPATAQRLLPSEELALLRWQELHGYGDDWVATVRLAALRMRTADDLTARRVALSSAPALLRPSIDLTDDEGWDAFVREWRRR